MDISYGTLVQSLYAIHDINPARFARIEQSAECMLGDGLLLAVCDNPYLLTIV